jgi:hypothetical protein
MKPLQLEFEATVYWVDGSHPQYSETPSVMRRFRSLDQAVSFVLQCLPSDLRPDVRILTADKTLMFDEVVTLGATVGRHSEVSVSLPSRRFGQGTVRAAAPLKA